MPEQSYDPEFFSPLFDTEERHFWFRARNRLIMAMLKGILPQLPEDYRLVEIGCGTGNVLRVLEPLCGAAHISGMDLFMEGLRFARRRVSCALVQADLQAPPFGRKVEVVGMFDVLEHLENDGEVLEQVAKLIIPGGWLLLTVPAFMELWSYFDVASHHARRYRRKELTGKLESAGFEVQQISYTMLLAFPLVWLQRHLSGVTTKHEEMDEVRVHDRAMRDLRIVPVINEILAFLLSLEAPLVAGGVSLPFGSSLIAIAIKK